MVGILQNVRMLFFLLGFSHSIIGNVVQFDPAFRSRGAQLVAGTMPEMFLLGTRNVLARHQSHAIHKHSLLYHNNFLHTVTPINREQQEIG